MKRIIDTFERVYIVNLPERTDRKRETIAEFRRIGIEVPNAHIRFLEATRPANANGFPSVGSLGNFISQTRVLAECLQDNIQSVLICEDDIQFNHIVPADTQTILTDINAKDWNVLSLAYLEPEYLHNVQTGLTPWEKSTRGTHFYAIRGDAIRDFHDYLVACRNRPSGHPDGGALFFDGAFNLARSKVDGVRFYIANPSLAGQRASRTDLHRLSFFDRVEPFRSAASLARQLKNMIKSRKA